MVVDEMNTSKAEAFSAKMIGILNDAGLALMISIGHRTKLFDTMSVMLPATSNEIAAKAGLNERYVREWLGAMVTGGIIEYDLANVTYFLPPEHAAFLTRAAVPNNLASPLQFFSVLGSVEDQIVHCFKHGGGVPYTQFNRFHEVMAEESEQTVVSALIDTIIPTVPGLVDRLRRGIDVLDVGCGSGLALILMARSFPNSHFIGYDFSSEAIERATAEAAKFGLSNIRFEKKDVTSLDNTDKFDLITAFDAIHDQAHPAEVLAGIANTLRDDGHFLMQDIAGSSYLQNNKERPMAPFLYTISCMHCMTVSLAENGDGLGTMWGEEKACEMLLNAGFKSVEVKTLPHDIMNFYYIVKKA
jgi:2-polyprenyl-3-methyl-5-hydroxy-6-metoxy-1,4-benzoquinol methylase